MAFNKFTHSIDIQQYFVAKILHTTNGGWICSIGNDEVFLPDSQLFKNIEDKEACVGKSIRVMVQRSDRSGTVVSHKDYISKVYERKEIISQLKRGQTLPGIIKGITEKGYQINVMGIIGFMHIEENSESNNYEINTHIDICVQKADAEKSILLLSEKLLKKNKFIVHKKQQYAQEEDTRRDFITKVKLGDELNGLVKKSIPAGFIIELSNGVRSLLRTKDIPQKINLAEGSNVNVSVSEINKEKNLFYVSITYLQDIKWKKLKTFVEENFIPNKTVVIGKVVYLEKDIVTLQILHEDQIIYGYIKNKDLSWEKVLNASEIVYLHEDLKVRYLYCENRRFYFDLKWQSEDLYPKELFDMNVDELLSSLNIHDNMFAAKVSIIFDRNNDRLNSTISCAIATNIIPLSEIDKNSQLVDKYTGANISALIPNRYAYGLEDGKYYRFTLEVASREKRNKEHRPYMFIAQLSDGAIALSDPFKEYVEKSFKENKTPKSNRESASYLKEIGADMYTDRDRMFYELLQNADDASSPKGVKVMVQVKDNYLIFTHDGLSFSKQDFRSIVSTANSTKRLDRKKTGYKGIGFKSVFTDSEKVYIKTGGFFFVFNRNAEIFNSFRDFYRYVNPLYSEEQLQLFFEDNRENEEEFEGVDHLPWQLLPFWVDDCPEVLRGTSFMRNCNVAIALEMDATADKYREIIKGIIKKPRFMLFLRNTLRIQFGEKKWELLSISKHEDKETGVVILKNSFDETEEEVSYIVKEGCNIPVDNEYFAMCDIPIKKECKRHGSREKWFMYQIVDNTEIPITSIPERIIAADTTTLSYAFMLDEKGQAIAVPDKTPSLYAYLPMEDRRYLFPFYINADFELSSNRQEAKRVSVWNEFLFYNIGKEIVSWVASLATKSHPAYLNLLPKEFFAEELEEGKIDRLAYQFNRGYKEALKADAFLRNDEGFVASQNDVLIDESGFAKIIGANDFCKLMSLNKRLIAPDIDCKPLANTNMFTEIEHLHTSNLVNSLLDDKNRYRLLRYWHQISKDKRNDILRHIVSMPRNHKNLFEYIKDIPAYNYGRQSFSLNKLLRSTKCILRLKSLEQIFPILQKLGFCITDTEEYNHPFHDVLKEEIEAYTLHVFDIISQCTSKKAALLNADEKNRLFMHFSSAKYTLKHEQLSKWCLFSNERGNQCVLDNLTHIDSALYGGITAPFVINETEFIVAPKLLGNYMMKEKNQYDKIVINQWESLVDQVGTSEELALSLYKFTSNTYLMAEHEQADEINTNVLLGKPFVFVNKHMMLLSDVIISDVFADNNNIKEIIEYLTEKNIPSSKVTKALFGKPFDCRSTDFEHLTIKENKVLSKVQLTAILDFCAANKDTIFTKYHIVQEESNYMLSPLSDNEVVAYTDDNRLQTFINTNCTNIKLLPSTYANYKSVKGVLTEETLLLRVLEELDSVDKHLASLLPIYHNSVSAVKKCFIGKISCIELRKDSLSENDDYSLQIFKIASTIEKIDKTLYDSIREKIDILADENSTKLIDIQLQHTVEVEGIKYPLSKLLPNEDKLARTVDVLKERLEDKVSSTFADNIFGDEVDSNRASSIFAELNKEQKILENGAQLAFVLEFAKSQKGNDGIKCKVHNKAAIPIACDICKYWLLEGQSFIDDNYILHTEYEDISRYIKIPYTGTNINCTIENSITDYQYVKSELNDDEKNSLLDYILDRYNKGIIPQSSEFATIRKCLGLSHFDYVVSKKFALTEEQIPNLIELWRNKENTDCRTKFLINIFGFHGEDSDIVSVRRYLSDFGNTPNVFTSETLSKMTCAWIVENDMLINDGQFAILQDILLGNDFETLVDFDKMNQCVSSQRPYLSFGNYALYLYPSEIPWKAVIKEAQYPFHTFVEDDIAIKGYTIYVNEDCESEIKDLVKSIINTEGFSADDFVLFLDAYQGPLTGTLEGEIDEDLDEDARKAASELARNEALSWLSVRGYDTSHATTDFSFIQGVRKGTKMYHIVVKSFRSKKRELKINPNEWLELLKENARLMLYMGHMSFAVIDRKTLLGNHDFLRLRISSSNFSLDNGKLDYTIRQLAENIQMFERTHFVFEHVNESVLTRADSLDGFGLYKSNSDEVFTAGNEDDIL